MFQMTAEKKDKFICSGKIERVDDTNLLITELPVKKWTQPHKEMLEAMLVGDGKKPAEIRDLRENHTETTVSFTITADKENIDKWEADNKGKGLEGKFKLNQNRAPEDRRAVMERLERSADPEHRAVGALMRERDS